MQAYILYSLSGMYHNQGGVRHRSDLLNLQVIDCEHSSNTIELAISQNYMFLLCMLFPCFHQTKHTLSEFNPSRHKPSVFAVSPTSS